MYRNTLPCLYELRDKLTEPDAESSFLRNLNERLSENGQLLRLFKAIERDLAGLDDTAWTDVKSRIIADRLLTKGGKRGYSQLMDLFNEAKAYGYLRQRGLAAVRFIPRGGGADGKTPDLQAEGGRVLCEVKTINRSQAELDRSESGGLIHYDLLDANFFVKLENVLATARRQITEYDPDPTVTRIVFVVINFDDQMHQVADSYGRQIDEHKASRPKDGLEVEFWWKPPFEVSRSD